MGAPVPDLHPRWIECLRLVQQGKSTKEICRVLNLSPNTVDIYLHRAAGRLGVSNRYDAARLLAQYEVELDSKESLSRSEGVELALQTTPPSDHQPRKLRWLLLKLNLFSKLEQIGGEYHELDVGDILLRIVKVSALSTVGVASIIAMAFWIIKLMD